MSTPFYKFYIQKQDELEKKYGEKSVVLMMVGSFYEIYGYDCKKLQCGHIDIASNILSFAKTLKSKKKPHSINNPYMCGFPCQALSKHLSTLLQNNMTVAVYNQSDNINKKEKDRVLDNIYSPSTYIDNEVIQNNELMCIIIEEILCPIHKIKLMCGYISHIDLSTGNNMIYEYYDTKENQQFVINEINKLLLSINPCEIITNYELIVDQNILIHELNTDNIYKNINYQKHFFEKIFGEQDVIDIFEYLNLHRSPDLSYCYIQLLQFAYEHNPNIIKKIKIPENNTSHNYLQINHDAFTQLNIFNKDNTDLFDIINHTSTKMGHRLLKTRITRPIFDQTILKKRYHNISLFMKNFKDFKKILQNINDIEKLSRKLLLNQLPPNQFASLDLTFQNIIILLKKSINTFGIEQDIINHFEHFYTKYKQIFNIDIMTYSIDFTKSFFNKNNFHDIDILDQYITDIDHIFTKIQGMLENQRAQVTLQYTDKEGYSIQTTKRAWNDIKNENRQIKLHENKEIKIPFICELNTFTIQKNNGNYVKLTCPVIEICEQKKKQYTIKLENLLKVRYKEVCEKLCEEFLDNINQVIDIISEIDISVSGAITSIKNNYCCPEIIDDTESKIYAEEIRHPIIEKINDDNEYVTNNLNLGHDYKCMLLFGLNSSGKSSLLRAIGCNVILAQMGMYVPSKSFKICLYTKLLTKISSHDNLYRGQSTFVSEMTELRDILLCADKNTLTMFDELTSGTETNSSIGIVCSSILELLKKKCNLLFTTHLHEINHITEITKNKLIKLYHFDILLDNNTLNFNRKLKEGSGSSEYGIEIADKLNLPKDFIKNAYNFRNKFKGESKDFVSKKKSRYNSKIFVDQCQMCGSKKNLQTHHIHEQQDADKHGMIEHFHKNIKFNLLVVCEECHQSIHHH